jgi:N-acylneuraminate cytidylyltransferase
MKRLLIIPARIGSKRILKKNIKLFLKKPIINYSIKTAKLSNLFDKIHVSTVKL